MMKERIKFLRDYFNGDLPLTQSINSTQVVEILDAIIASQSPSNDMIEVVARAICEARYKGYQVYDDIPAYNRDNYRRQAKAAIAAILTIQNNSGEELQEILLKNHAKNIQTLSNDMIEVALEAFIRNTGWGQPSSAEEETWRKGMKAAILAIQNREGK